MNILKNIKGWRTIAVNVVTAVVLLSGAAVDPAIVQENVDTIIAAIAAVNVLLRAITTTPLGKSE